MQQNMQRNTFDLKKVTKISACSATDGNGSILSCSRVLHMLLNTLVRVATELALATFLRGDGAGLDPSNESLLPKPELLPYPPTLRTFSA